MSSDIAAEIAAFRRKKDDLRVRAGQTVALALLAGVDLDRLMSATAEEKVRAVLRLERLVERERLRGARRHWSYDLNRHIALKQALDSLRGGDARGSAQTQRAAPRRRRPLRKRASAPA